VLSQERAQLLDRHVQEVVQARQFLGQPKRRQQRNGLGDEGKHEEKLVDRSYWSTQKQKDKNYKRSFHPQNNNNKNSPILPGSFAGISETNSVRDVLASMMARLKSSVDLLRSARSFVDRPGEELEEPLG
jgi:hypothetical protein